MEVPIAVVGLSIAVAAASVGCGDHDERGPTASSDAAAAGGGAGGSDAADHPDRGGGSFGSPGSEGLGAQPAAGATDGDASAGAGNANGGVGGSAGAGGNKNGGAGGEAGSGAGRGGNGPVDSGNDAGSSCTASNGGQEAATIHCSNGAAGTVAGGAGGQGGIAGSSGADGSSGALSSGVDDGACTVADNGDGTATLFCADGTATLLTTPEKPPGRRHVILIVGDGMQFEHEIATSRYLYGTDYAMSWRRFPYQGYCSTWDVDTYNSYAALAGAASYSPLVPFDATLGYDPALGGVAPYPVSNPAGAFDYFAPGGTWRATDSAASASAMSTGQKTSTGNIAWEAGDPADGALPTIAETLRAERGFAIGVVSSVPFSHATPAAFVAHNPSRGDYYGIAEEIVGSTKPEVVIGAGYAAPGTTSGYISSETLIELQSSPDVVLVEQEPGVDGGDALLAGASEAVAYGQRLFGLFASAGGDCENRTVADAPGAPAIGESSPEYPRLADAALAALEVLAADEDGFFLLLEQGNIDWANHANSYSHMISCVADLEEAVISVVAFVNREGDAIDWTNTLVLVTADHANSAMRLSPDVVLGAGDLPAVSPSDCSGGCSFPDGEVSYGTFGHTNELVTLSAIGMDGELGALMDKYEGLDQPGTSIIDDTALYFIMRTAGGL